MNRNVRAALGAALLLGLLGLANVWNLAHAQQAGTITFTAQTTTGDVSVVPVLTWSTTPPATGCTASGAWTGPRGASGTATLPAITASATYNLACDWADNRATLSWTAPTTNTDGSALTDLAGYRIYYGTAAADLNQSAAVNSATATSAVVQPLTSGPWFFSMTAINSRSIESARTPTVTKTVGTASAQRSVGITVNPRPSPPTNVTAT